MLALLWDNILKPDWYLFHLGKKPSKKKKEIKNQLVSVSHLAVQLQNQLYEHYWQSNIVMEAGMERFWARTSEVPAKTGHPMEPNSSMSGSGWKLDGTTWWEKKGFLKLLEPWVQVWLQLWLKKAILKAVGPDHITRLWGRRLLSLDRKTKKLVIASSQMFSTKRKINSFTGLIKVFCCVSFLKFFLFKI